MVIYRQGHVSIVDLAGDVYCYGPGVRTQVDGIA